eukprot:TRINITY_DN864_c0_g1_i2.p1 TRINITY_DN864_c0_g1~~TRINITY_DN864_c0_g1_i2.p1  ORF type:complete len:386 (-),score=83.83 TRINITY_DN864_c0_g1_i2:743-1900(-)
MSLEKTPSIKKNKEKPSKSPKDNQSNSIKEFTTSTSIDELVKYLVVERFGCADNSCKAYTDKLKENLVTTVGLLCRLSPERLARLQLPLLLEEELAKIIELSNQRKPLEPYVMPKSGSIVKKDSPAVADRSVFLGITQEERRSIIASWKAIIDNEKGKNLSIVFEKFYENFFSIDKTARRLFKDRPVERQAKALMKVMQMIMSTLEDPTTMLPYLQRLGARHLIYGVYQKDFQSWAIAMTKTLHEVIPDIMTPQLKEAWFVLVTKLGMTMTESYEQIKNGIKSVLFRSYDKKKYYVVLTHECIKLYKDQNMTKEANTLWLKWVSELDLCTDDKITKNNFQHNFTITLNSVSFVFGVETEDELSWWLEELSERVGAYQRINLDEDR